MEVVAEEEKEKTEGEKEKRQNGYAERDGRVLCEKVMYLVHDFMHVGQHESFNETVDSIHDFDVLSCPSPQLNLLMDGIHNFTTLFCRKGAHDNHPTTQPPTAEGIKQPVIQLFFLLTYTKYTLSSHFHFPVPTISSSPFPSHPTTMSSVVHTFHKTRSFLPSRTLPDALPLSHTDSPSDQTLRRRLSSLSLRIQPISSPATAWAFRKSKSMSSFGDLAGSSVRKWWDWGWAWILSRKPIFAKDLEMNEEESKILGSQNRGSWKHVFFKFRSEIRKLIGSDVALPQTTPNYRSFNFPNNNSGIRT
ncbi:uncharacterized protein E6C27_scaffold133G00710 [Cucumis melo var. makuwa]|uniref:Uncharacterized protein n=2 Tax=Cucumis melo TaxID=3656 RepID=A0A5A7U301_CUCMM|nr:uncharacterized protein E6C27_scaffold133G00710 [Cucumis melo var. makuwa]